MSEPLLSMADIARLAGVERPVVSMWRQRPKARGQVLPFPEPTPGGDLDSPQAKSLTGSTRVDAGTTPRHASTSHGSSSPNNVTLAPVSSLSAY